MLRVGVIGYGYWGPNLVRNFAENAHTEVVAVSDLRQENLGRVARRYPGIRTGTDCKDMLRDPQVDIVAVATPVRSHYELALAALQAGKHVLIEKPMTESSDQAKHLVEEAARRNLKLMVDHTFIYTGAVRKIRELVSNGDLGDVYYYDSSRINLGLFQHDVDVIWDLAVHDLSILDYVLEERPLAVCANGASNIAGSPENLAYITVFFGSGTIAHINVNWLAPVKLRRTLVGGSKKMIVYDDLDPAEKIRVYDKGVDVVEKPSQVYDMLVSYRTGDMWAPRLDETEALSLEIAHFADCIEHGKQPLTDGEMGLRVVELLEAASASMRQQGRRVDIDWS